MKKLFVFLAVLGMFGLGFSAWLGSGPEQAPSRRVASNSSSGTVIDVEVPGVNAEPQIADGVTYQIISMPGEVLAALDVGKPQVPKLSFLLGRPDNSSASVSVDVLESKTFDNVLCYPYQTPLKDNDINNPFVIDRQFYTTDKPYPSYSAKVMNTGVWRELSVANVEVYPVQYNPALKQLTVATRLRVHVNYSGGTYTRKLVQPWLAGMYARWIDNFGQLDLGYTGGTDDAGVQYLVIAHDNWYNNPDLVDSLLGWHCKRGIATRLIHKASWTQQEIKDSIYAEYSRHTPAELRWVLLVGEYAEIPMEPEGGVGNGDYWYSDLLPPGSPDNYPEIGLGRLSPSSAGDLHNQISKILKYTKNPPSTPANWLSKHALIACAEYYPDKYSACVRGIFNEPMAYYRYNFDTLMCYYHGNDSIQRILEEGRGIVTYRGHGDWDEWYTLATQGGSPWYVSNVAALNNGDLTPMVFNICCLSGDISQATCLSEEWMRKYPGGGCGSLAATQASYTYPNHGICSTLVRSLCDTWSITNPGYLTYTLPTFDIGWIQCNIDAYVAKYWPGSPYPDNIYMYALLGDPSMEAWSGGQPQTANVTYQPTVPIGPYDLQVNVAVSGTPVKGALVCAWKDPDFWVNGYTDQDGNVTLSINSTSPGMFDVTVSGGHANASPPTPILPFEGTCLARTSSAPYVIHYRHSIDDASPGGNGDGIVNPGEIVNMPTWVKNLGAVTGNSVTGKLRTADAAVTVTDSAKSFGTIAPGDSASTGTNGFKFHVGDTCSNGHNIVFTLVCQDNLDSTWSSNFSVHVGTGVLSYVSKRVEDPPPGGNNNGKIDPGEDAQVFISLHNAGLGNGYNVHGVLRSGNALFTITDSTAAWGTIPHDTAIEATDAFGVHADGSILPETPIPCTLYAYADGNYHVVLPFNIVVGEITTTDPIPDNATPPQYWEYDDADVGYTEHPVYNWQEISGVGTALSLGDDQITTISIPPAFGPIKYYGQRYTTLSICSNGFVSPGTNTLSPWTNAALPSSTLGGPAICLVWDDLYPPTGNGVWYCHDTLNHAFVVEYDSVSYYPSGSAYDKYEVIFYDTTLASPDGQNKIVVQYATANAMTGSTVGIQNQDYTLAIPCFYSGTYTRGVSPIIAQHAMKYTTSIPTTGIVEQPSGIASLQKMALGVFPNPFKGTARIYYQIPTAGKVTLKVFDASGREVRTLLNSNLKPGSYTTNWNATDNHDRAVSAGIYFYRLTTPTGVHSIRATLLR